MDGDEVTLTQARETTRVKSLQAGASSRERRKDYEAPKAMASHQQQERARDEAHFLSEASLEYSLNLIERRLEERREIQREEGTSSAICIFRLPRSLVGINNKSQQPEIVSIGPYHRGKNHLLKFEEHKWSFLDKLLSRISFTERNLYVCLGEMRELEKRTRECYSDNILMSSHDFIEMMLLDGCFVIELLRHLGHSQDVINEDDPIFTRPWLIPILLRDLLKLENQIPYFVLQYLFEWSRGLRDNKADDLSVLASKVFDLAFPRSREIISTIHHLEAKHLLDLVYLSHLPSNQVTNFRTLEEYRPSNQSIQCITQLRSSGIKFKSNKDNSFLDIKFKNRALQIPTITINDFTSTLLINSVAWEQYQEDIGSKYFTDYVCFMNCLINQPRDVAFLCMDGIITRFSQDDHSVVNLFNKLGKNVVFSNQNCYLSKQFKGVEAYYSSYWGTMMRTYFSSPWSFISVFSAFIVIVLTMIQTIMSVLSYCRQFG
ncbi:unnamed protein product [Ilex paraguariensis]|uniref:Uncharacterized protein n=1 Tax=Ilex paraguariensis TaxID=185542 RepID=A0ABC8S9E3_9AQUA